MEEVPRVTADNSQAEMKGSRFNLAVQNRQLAALFFSLCNEPSPFDGVKPASWGAVPETAPGHAVVVGGGERGRGGACDRCPGEPYPAAAAR